MSAEVNEVVIEWSEWSTDAGTARCPVCGSWFTCRQDGRLRYHGPANRRCKGSLAAPPTDLSTQMLADLAFGPLPASPVPVHPEGEEAT